MNRWISAIAVGAVVLIVCVVGYLTLADGGGVVEEPKAAGAASALEKKQGKTGKSGALAVREPAAGSSSTLSGGSRVKRDLGDPGVAEAHDDEQANDPDVQTDGVDDEQLGEHEMQPYPVSADGIRNAVAYAMPDLKECYEGWIQENEELGGRVVVEFTISGGDEGIAKITKAEIGETELDHVVMEGCVLNVFEDLSFENPADGGEVKVNYPLIFAQD